jgi:HIRAN domain/GIY-YIG catalytic domain
VHAIVGQRTVRIAIRGTRYYDCEAAIARGELFVGAAVALHHQPWNIHDHNAVAVVLLGSKLMLGHVRRDLAQKFAELVKAGAVKSAKVVKISRGLDRLGVRPIVHIVVLYAEPPTEKASPLWQICKAKLASLAEQPGVYAIICASEHRIYVGESANIKARIRNHFADLIEGNHVNSLMQSDFSRLGPGAFRPRLIARYTDPAARQAAEADYISTLLSRGSKLYNMTSDGKGRMPDGPGYSNAPPISDWQRNSRAPQPSRTHATSTPELGGRSVSEPCRKRGTNTVLWAASLSLLILFSVLGLTGH